MTPEERQKHEEANDKEKEIEDEEKKIADEIAKKSFSSRLAPYSKPVGNIILGLIVSALQGCIFPFFGIFISKMLFGLMNTDKQQLREDADKYCLYMALLSVLSFCTGFGQKFSFGVVGENITLNVRDKLYRSILKKNIGWFDRRDNAPGVLTGVLASEAQTLNGASTEGTAVMIESFCAMICGIVIGFIYSWRVALVALACSPFMMLGGAINAKFQAGMDSGSEEQYKSANLLAGDAIMNYRTVASFAHDERIVARYNEHLEDPTAKGIKQAHIIAFCFGFSQFVQYGVWAVVYYSGAEFMYHFGTTGDDVFVSMFALMFGAFAAGQAQQFGPDLGKAKLAAIKIFTYIDMPSRINAVDEDSSKVSVPKDFKGEIEFKDVWFRYPSRPEDWILKGLNLKINSNESVAVVGESGAGKSTLVGLILRFYDVNHGEILIDGTNIKEYKLNELRERMGLVMQEPTLFNYTVLDNILYGKSKATNEEIREAVQIANAAEFIESHELTETFDTSADALMQGLEQYKTQIMERGGKELYDRYVEDLKTLKKKEDSEGKFQVVQGIFDERPEADKKAKMPPGYDINCGLKGNRLSGGQKQRVAIARAIIRKPNILILDEATSALDEESQRKVQVALERVMDGRTSIVIAHRLTTVEKCSKVVVLENGKVIDEGKFKDLQNKKGGYFQNIAKGMKKQEKEDLKKKRQSSNL